MVLSDNLVTILIVLVTTPTINVVNLMRIVVVHETTYFLVVQDV